MNPQLIALIYFVQAREAMVHARMAKLEGNLITQDMYLRDARIYSRAGRAHKFELFQFKPKPSYPPLSGDC